MTNENASRRQEEGSWRVIWHSSMIAQSPRRSWPDAQCVPHDARNVYVGEADLGGVSATISDCSGSSHQARALVHGPSLRSAQRLPGRGRGRDNMADGAGNASDEAE